jgi:hypothetical protein
MERGEIRRLVGCGRNAEAIRAILVGRASPLAYFDDTRAQEASCEDARQGSERGRSPYEEARTHRHGWAHRARQEPAFVLYSEEGGW